MKPIPNLFLPHDDNPSRVTKIINPECDWVTSGSGIAKRYYDGTFYMLQADHLYRHHEVKKGEIMPDVFMLTWTDSKTGTMHGWSDVIEGDSDYELLSHFNSGDVGIFVFKEGVMHNINKTQDYVVLPKGSRNYDGLSNWIKNMNIDGVLFKNPDGRMAVVTRKQLGL